MEGAPGLAKTKAIKTLSDEIEGNFQRIQFTPDLLPSDITGTEIYRPENASFVFQEGPIFHNLVLADEINRAPAKVQSALLEAMSERQVSVGRNTMRLPELFLLIVIGGGYVGCELAQMFARLGVKVTILYRSRLLPEAEPEISQALAGYFGDEGITVQRVGEYEAIQAHDGGVALSVTIDGAVETIEAQRVMLSAGRKANTGGLGLEEAGVALSPNGGIEVDDRMRTTRDGVYAAGDVTGRDQFVYMAPPRWRASR